MKTYFKQLFIYDKWATQHILDKFDKQFPQNPRIYELLSHMLSAQRIWLDRCMDLPQSVEIFKERFPEELKNDLENYHLEWTEFIDQLQDDDLDTVVKYKNLKGQNYEDKLSDIITQVINHGTHHRGAILVLMKEEGLMLPTLDYIYFIRS